MVLLLQHHQTPGTQTCVIHFADVLRFVQREVYQAALAFSHGIRLAFKGCIAAFAADDLVFVGVHWLERL
jgi:hypothetical protein